MDNKVLAHELAKKYTFEKFDFQSGSPEDLLKLYQDTESKIYNTLTPDDPKKEIRNKSLEDCLSVYDKL